MSKIAILKDPHFRLGFPSPISRKDDYKETLYQKVNFVINQCKKNKIKHLVITGDLFDKKYIKNYNSMSVKENLELLRYINSKGIGIVSIAGNHDLPYNNYNNVEDSLYGLASKLGLIKDISYSKIKIKNAIVYGIPYTEDRDHLFAKLKEINETDVLEKKFVVIHEHFIPFDAEIEDLKFSHFYRYSELHEYKNISGFILGHLHRGFPIQKFSFDDKEQIFINIWSFFRLSRSYYTSMDLHTPEMAILDLETLEAETITIPHKPYKDVFINNIEEDEDELEEVDLSFFTDKESILGMENSINKMLDECTDNKVKETLSFYLEKVGV